MSKPVTTITKRGETAATRAAASKTSSPPRENYTAQRVADAARLKAQPEASRDKNPASRGYMTPTKPVNRPVSKIPASKTVGKKK